jgi:hypothetical protein
MASFQYGLAAVAIGKNVLGVVALGERVAGLVAIGKHGFGLVPLTGDFISWIKGLFD